MRLILLIRWFQQKYREYWFYTFVGIQYLFGILSPLLFGQIIPQAVPKEYFFPFYVSILIIYIYHYYSTHVMTFDVYISTSIISYTVYDDRDIYKIAGKYINIYQIVCKYISNKIV